jgi:AcrR family transcriptional regulator
MLSKPPRRTRERILETALRLFNDVGEPSVTTADIADDMNISPGNLYYHVRNKDEIIALLFARLDASLSPLLGGPAAGAAHVEDLWLFMHLLFERIWEYRFFYRDLDEITSRDRGLAARFADLLRREQFAVLELCRGLRSAGALRASDAEIATMSVSIVIVATNWMSYQRLSRVTRGGRDAGASSMQFGQAISQVLALVHPYLVGEQRELVALLGEGYGDSPAARS